MKITVLCGGESPERAVSLRSGERVAAALRARGHRVSLPEYHGDLLTREEIRHLQGEDAVFLALHGGSGEDGSLQLELEENGIFHYTGSAPAGAALAMEKDRAKARVSSFGIPVARGARITAAGEMPDLAFPLVIKPVCGGSSVGLRFVKNRAEWVKKSPPVGSLCEEFLPGREYTVGVLCGRPLPVVEIRPIGGAYDYKHKYTPGASEEICPAELTPAAAERLLDFAVVAFAVLGLRDYARLDFREDAAGTPRFMEANTLPGMTETSLFPLAARTAGIPFPLLCEQMAQCAAERGVRAQHW